MTAVLPQIDLPDIVAEELRHIIFDTMAAHPRTLQQAIGPSELGTPCSRSLIHKLSGDVGRSYGDGWLATVGTAVHAYLEGGFARHRANQGEQPRYLLEHRVNVGHAAGQDIWGNADVFDIDSGTVIDWKVVGRERLKSYRVNGPGRQYRTQAHLYGRGFALQQYAVHHVMIVFLPRDGLLNTRWTDRDNSFGAYAWAEPWDESVALQALSRVNGLWELLQAVGRDALLDAYSSEPPCGSYFCPWCKSLR